MGINSLSLVFYTVAATLGAPAIESASSESFIQGQTLYLKSGYRIKTESKAPQEKLDFQSSILESWTSVMNTDLNLALERVTGTAIKAWPTDRDGTESLAQFESGDLRVSILYGNALRGYGKEDERFDNIRSFLSESSDTAPAKAAETYCSQAEVADELFDDDGAYTEAEDYDHCVDLVRAIREQRSGGEIFVATLRLADQGGKIELAGPFPKSGSVNGTYDTLWLIDDFNKEAAEFRGEGVTLVDFAISQVESKSSK